jgi:hypothetical protein
MTTRLVALTVILEGEPRDDDAESIIAAIRQLRGVADVQVFEMSSETRIAEHRAKLELRKKLLHLLVD